MSKRVWTKDQNNAINVKNRTILVSAAAGSGKTAALSERVIRKITSKDNPIDADKLLIVTFTKAAAAEMRERISTLLSDIVDKNPYDLYFKRQQSLLKHADICTIHSFCGKVVRENFYKLGISPNFRIADQNEISILEERAMKSVLDEFYNEGKKDFFDVVELFSNEKDDNGLVKIIGEIYKFIGSCTFPDKWFEDIFNMYKQKDISSSPWGKVLFEYVIDTCLCCEYLIKTGIDLLNNNDDLKKVYIDALNTELLGIETIKCGAEKGLWDDTLNNINKFKRGRRKTLTEEYKSDFYVNKIEYIRDYTKKCIDGLKKRFAFDEKCAKLDMKNVASVTNILFDITKRFAERISKLKEEKNVAEFNDLEHWMLKLLIDKDPQGNIKRSSLAEEISCEYEEIMVDEYQDTNEVQDMIFRMISRDESNLFMVGDIKQSIYGFRQAMPEIFMKKKENYKLYDGFDSKDACKIILGKNFRSRKGVIKTVNFIFDKLMTKESGNIDYNDEEKLICGASYSEKEDEETVVEIINLNDEEDADKAEAIRISEIISKMIKEGYCIKDRDKERPVTYKDFCILLRSANKHATVYAKELSERGIPAWSDTMGKFFGTAEVAGMLSLLRVIDNPIQDIPLLATLASPIFGFSPDELSDIRLAKKEAPLYLALKEKAELGDTRCKEFIDKIDDYRRHCSTLTVEKLINYIYNDTGYESIILTMTNGEFRVANLRMLCEYAAKYEGTVFRELSGFIDFIDKLENRNADLTPASTISEASNVVKIMSIHRSKGLEFPICILARCSGRFNKEKGNILIHHKLGIGIMLKDDNMSAKYTNFIRNAIDLKLSTEQMAEELRVLYVALTRAKEKLIFLISVKNISKIIKNDISLIAKNGKIPAYIVKNSSSYADWILSCMFMSKHAKNIYEEAGNPYNYCESFVNLDKWKINITDTKNTEIKSNITLEKELNYELEERIKKRFNFKYKYSKINHVPVKLSASKLAQQEEFKNYLAVSRPAFMLEKSVSPAERGTALHEFLHFANYSLALEDANSHLKELCDKGFLTYNQAKVININDVNTFLNSELGKRIIKSSNVLREYRFTVSVPAYDLDKGETLGDDREKVIIQGAIDCVFKEDDGYVIVDYKTDRVKDLDHLKEKYTKQLNIYKHAFEICENVNVKELIVYSLPLGMWIKI